MNVRHSQNCLAPLEQPLVWLVADLCQPCRESGPLNSWPQALLPPGLLGDRFMPQKSHKALGEQHKASPSAPVFLPFLLLNPGTKSASPFWDGGGVKPVFCFCCVMGTFSRSQEGSNLPFETPRAYYLAHRIFWRCPLEIELGRGLKGGAPHQQHLFLFLSSISHSEPSACCTIAVQGRVSECLHMTAPKAAQCAFLLQHIKRHQSHTDFLSYHDVRAPV